MGEGEKNIIFASITDVKIVDMIQQFIYYRVANKVSF